ncbi:MAG: hypothetical protein ACKVRN_02400 [Pyrinomonadaceae bacterium]
MEITLTAFSAHFRFYVLNNVKVVSQPMLAFDLFFDGVASAKLANHVSSVTA